MPKVNQALWAFNRGTVSPLALARTDVERLRLSAETQTNWMPRVLGPMMLRPGTEYITGIYNNQATRVLPFIFSSDDTALLELTDELLRPLVDEDVITRPSVDTVVDGFDVAASWSTTTSGGGTVSFAGDQLTFYTGATGGVARVTQTVTLGASSSGVEHALRIVVNSGPLAFRVGSTSGDDDLISTTTLDDGTHSLAFTPTTNFYIQFEAQKTYQKRVTSIELESAGTLMLPTPWAEADLEKIRFTQSADVIFVACEGYQQQRIERRATRSWSVVTYKTDDGPFNSSRDTSISVTPAGLNGNINLTASKNLFKSGHVGSLLRLFHSGQRAGATLSAEETYTDPVRISGTGVDRNIVLNITGTWSGTLYIQRSIDAEDSGFADTGTTFTSNQSNYIINDGLTNTIAWYRVGFKTGTYTSGSATITLSYQGGGGAGVVRILTVTNATTASAEVLSRLFNTSATYDYKFGAWSDVNGWPTSVELHEGRLWWSGNDRFWGSVSDAYNSFDPDYEGDAGPIDRSIGQGPIARVHWLASLTRLLAGCDRSVVTARSSSFDEPLTPTNFNLKDSSTQGAYGLPAVKIDARAVYVQASNRRVYEMLFDVQTADYRAQDLTRLNPDIGMDGFVDLAVQRQPDTMIHFVRADGKVAVLLYDTQDQVEAWWLIETSGTVENVVVLPGEIEDKVYYVVRRTINGTHVRYLERFARIDQCEGGELSRCMDAHYVYSGASTDEITGLDHLINEQVEVWADGADVGPLTVTGDGRLVLDTAATKVCVGLSYDATFVSAKLAYAAAGGSALTQVKRIDHLGLILANAHYQGLTYGQDEDHLDALPLVEDGTTTAADTVWEAYDKDMLELNGSWDTDARLVLKASAPRPMTVMAAIVGLTTNG